MTNGGPCLETWQKVKFSMDEDKKMDFMLEMLAQVIPGLHKLHEFGYSHGDLKLENICARKCRDGSFKFTLIDLGMCSTLRQPCHDTRKKPFRGNYIFCSPTQIINSRASALDDLYSLLCVAYTFVFGKLPWLKKADELSDANPEKNMYDLTFFK